MPKNFGDANGSEGSSESHFVTRSDLESTSRRNGHFTQAAAGVDVSDLDSDLDIARQCVKDNDDSRIKEIRIEEFSRGREEGVRLAFTIGDQDDDPILAQACLAFAQGMYLTEGVSEEVIAIRFGVTKQAVNNRVIAYKEKYNIRARAMRSEEACQSYRENKLGDGHFRRPKNPAYYVERIKNLEVNIAPKQNGNGAHDNTRDS